MNEMPVFTPYTDKHFPLSLVYRYRINTRSKAVYLTILLSFALLLLALPFVYLEISVKGDGILQASIERAVLSAPVSGELIKIPIHENQKISRGDTVLQINMTPTDDQANFLTERLGRLELFQKDIRLLVNSVDAADFEKPAFSSGQYAASWQQFIQERAEGLNALTQGRKTLERYRYLYDNNAITLSEYEKISLEYDQLLARSRILNGKYKTQWQTEGISNSEEIRELRSKIAVLNEQRKLYTLISPFQGSVQNMSGLMPGSYIFLNQKIAEISPETELLACCYVSPADIGLIKKGQRVNFQIYAFNYHQWGLLHGRVLEISEDIIMSKDGKPVFKILCSLDKNFLQLGTTRGNLKKGMNFRASFRITERSLFQLLFDQTEDWLESRANSGLTQ